MSSTQELGGSPASRGPGHRSWASAALAGGILVAMVATGTSTPFALGRFVDGPTADVETTVDRLDPPTSATCNGGLIVCNATILARPQLAWTPTVDLYAEGYRVYRSTTNGSGYSLVATLPGRATSGWTDTGTVVPLTTYYYVVVAYTGSWTSVNSGQVAVTVTL